MKVKEIFLLIARKFTPIKMLALVVLVMGFVDNITSLLQHASSGGTITFQGTILEVIVRVAFIFCGLFGFLGNGRTTRFRATITAFPFLYLAVFYTILFIQYKNQILLSFIAMTAIPSLWVMFFGENYE